MRIDSAAAPFVFVAAIPAVVLLWVGPMWAIAALVLPIVIALFFRDPDRHPPVDPSLVLAPADGRVMFAGEAAPGEAPAGAWRQVTIFLSVLDVHINRSPVGGRVTRVDFVPGSFKPAYRHDAHRNEHSEIWLDHRGVTIVARQVVGMLARRVVCRVKAGQDLTPGARIGLMKFGSRMDVFVPTSAELLVSPGQQVVAGETPIARLTTQ